MSTPVRRRRRARVQLALGSVALLFLAAACGSVDSQLDAVRAFAQSATTAEPTFTAVASDFYASCVRQYNWQVAASSDPLHFRSLEEWCGEGAAPGGSQRAAQTCGAPQGAGQPPQAPCTAYDGSQQWQKIHAVLLAYMHALGGLADDEGNDYGLPKFADEVVALNGSTQWLGDLNANTGHSIAAFGKWVLDAKFAGKRRAALVGVVDQADPYVQDLTTQLREIAQMRYGEALRLETAAVDNYYATYLPRPPVIVPLADRTQYVRDRQAVAARYAAISAYTDALDRIAKGHAALVGVLTARTPGNQAAAERLVTGFARDVAVLAHVYGTDGERR